MYTGVGEKVRIVGGGGEVSVDGWDSEEDRAL